MCFISFKENNQLPTFNEKLVYYYKTKDNYPLSIKYAGITYPDKNFYIKRASSNMFIYEYIVEGVGYIDYNDKKYRLGAGDFYSISTGCDYAYYSDKTKPYKKLWFCGDGPLMECIHNSLFKNESLIIVHADYQEQMRSLLDILSSYNGSKQEYINISNLYISLMNALYVDYNSNEFEPNVVKDVSLNETAIFVKNYIDDNFTNELDLDKLCNQLYLTKVQLIRLFNKEYGTTPYKYYLEGKLEIAESLLLNTSLNIKEIARKVGYDDEYHFSQIFKKHYKVSPKIYRLRY